MIVRDLLNRLPLHNGPPPDLELFLRHIKGLTLPPRPSVEESAAATVSADGTGIHDGVSSWLRDGDNAEAADDGDGLVPLLGGGARGRAALLHQQAVEDDGDDPFRKRQRAKLQQ